MTSAVARGAVAGGQGQAGRKMLLAVGYLVGYGAWEHSTWLWDTPPHPQPCSMQPQIVGFRKKHGYLACPLTDKGFCPLCHVSTAASPFSKLQLGLWHRLYRDIEQVQSGNLMQKKKASHRTGINDTKGRTLQCQLKFG